MTKKRYVVSLCRTRLQSATVTVVARGVGEAEGLVMRRLEAGWDYDELAWSDGENEGEIDIAVATRDSSRLYE